MIGFTVLGGYLGAGKTTLLNHLLKHNKGQRFALLINDFGDINIDAQLITSQTDNQINLANGCVCCSLSDGFGEAIDQLQALSPPPDHIIVEASGVADVHKLSQYGHGQGLKLASVLVVADADTVEEKANDKYVAKTVRRQLAAADLILLNKIDLCTPEQRTHVRKWLADLVPDCPIIEAEQANVPVDVLFTTEPNASKAPIAEGAHAHFQGWSYRREGTVSLEQVQAFVDGLGPDVLRAKGLLANKTGGVIEVQVVGRRRNVTTHPDRTVAENQLVALGVEGQLDKAALDALARGNFG